MKKIIIICTLILSSPLLSQTKSLNKYKYIIVNNKFDFLKKVDQYKTSSFLKFLFKKEGFTVYLSNEEKPAELAKRNCMSLLATVKDNSNMFSTKNSIELKDCRGKTIVKTKEGVSKLKDYKRAYYEAIKEAFKDVKKLNYHFLPSNSVVELKPIKKTNTVKTVIKTDLFAQPIKNGFQLIDKKPSIIFTLLKTKKANTFIIKDKNGVMYKKEGVWIAEYYQKDKLVIETYQVKF